MIVLGKTFETIQCFVPGGFENAFYNTLLLTIRLGLVAGMLTKKILSDLGLTVTWYWKILELVGELRDLRIFVMDTCINQCLNISIIGLGNLTIMNRWGHNILTLCHDNIILHLLVIVPLIIGWRWWCNQQRRGSQASTTNTWRIWWHCLKGVHIHKKTFRHPSRQQPPAMRARMSRATACQRCLDFGIGHPGRGLSGGFFLIKPAGNGWRHRASTFEHWFGWL